jgi:alanine racemase
MDKIVVEIDLGNLRENYQKIQRWVGSEVKLMPIVKANAYGHGLLRVARELVAEGAAWLGVADIQEAGLLRREHPGTAILILARLCQAVLS